MDADGAGSEVNLVRDDEHRPVRLAELLGDFFVGRSQPLRSVDHEQDEIRVRDRAACLAAHLRRERLGASRHEPARVDEGEVVP